MERSIDQPNLFRMHYSNWSFLDGNRLIFYLCFLNPLFLLYLCHLLDLCPLIPFPWLFLMDHAVLVEVLLKHNHDNTICLVALLSTVVYNNHDDRREGIIHSKPFCQVVVDDDHRTQYIFAHLLLCLHIRSNTCFFMK